MSRTALTICLLLLCFKTYADIVRIGFSNNKPPYTMQYGGGLEIDISRAALAHSGHQLEPLYFDKNNLPRAFEQGRIDAMGNVHESQRGNKQHDSQPYVYYENYAISHAKAELRIDSVKDLAQQRIVAWQGANGHLGESFHRLFKPGSKAFGNSYLEHRDQVAQNRMFWQQKMDVIIVDKLLFEWHRHRLSQHIGTDTQVRYHDIFQRPTRFKMIFDKPALRDDFNAGLEHIKASGEYDRLYAKYRQPLHLAKTP